MMSSSKKASLLNFLTHFWDPLWLRSWAEPYHNKKGLKAFAIRQLEVFVLGLHSIYKEEITLRAAALTYNTLLSLVPLLAVGFALFKAFGGLQKLEGPLRKLIIDNLAVGRAQEVGRFIEQYIANINAGAIAGVGVLVLFYSAVGLLTNIEGSFNRIWGIRRGRPFVMRFFTYWGWITLAPPLLGFSVSLTARLQSSTYASAVVNWLPWGLGNLLLWFSSTLSTCLAFVLSYLIVPNTKVRVRAALLGGLIAGLLWNLTKSIFISVSASSLKYSAVYGAMGVLPLLMIWMYLSWLIVLFGASLAYANQFVHTDGLENSNVQMSPRFREQLAVNICICAAESFYVNKGPITIETITERLGTRPSLVQQIVDVLQINNLLVEARTVKDEIGYMPGRSLQDFHLASITDILHLKDGQEFNLKESPIFREVKQILEDAQRSSRSVLERVNLRSLAERASQESPAKESAI